MIEINIDLEAIVFTDYRTIENFKIIRKLRQECLLSLLLFCLLIELLLK
jgi:hypothetical protein